MGNSDRLNRFLRTKMRDAGRQVEEARRAFVAAKAEALGDEENGTFRIVCRRHAEKRDLPIDDDGRPPCYESGHPDCEGCVEDIRSGQVETW